MLKPLINIIKISFICFIALIIVSIIFEFVEFHHSRLIQEFSIGTTCSLIVVIISTLAQYKMELKRNISDHISATSKLIFSISLYTNYADELSDRNIEHAFEELEKRFEEFNKTKSEVIFLTKASTKKQLKRDEEITRLYLSFLVDEHDSHRDAVRNATKKDNLLRAIDTYLDFWPECYEKKNIDMVKNWLVEESAEEANHDQL